MILVIDNYDSFTYNLVQLIASRGRTVEVERNDTRSVDELLARRPQGIVLSPGPGRPEDAGVCLELLERRPALPVLGVCLGHQALGRSFGAAVERAPRLVHGKTSSIRHTGAGIFRDLPDSFAATRYHSLEVREATLPQEFEAVAWAEDGTLMGMAHRHLPYFGVQFHPESILTREGPRLLDNFLAHCGAEDRGEA
jgi:anthranilate synthase/aminodeoxychorismate synthase-like glutamine amidotransferase